ncbi:MAG: hypothetical protein JF628_01185 [Sphingomonas sp.]|nr:hypothetical protein [Sphingomonas sp.]
MTLVRLAGLLILLAGLFLVGISGDNHRIANGRRISYGATLMALGAVTALFAGAFEGWFAWAAS